MGHSLRKLYRHVYPYKSLWKDDFWKAGFSRDFLNLNLVGMFFRKHDGIHMSGPNESLVGSSARLKLIFGFVN